MHELGVVVEVVKTVEDFARANDLSKIQALVLQIGELSSMIPRYIQACYPAAVEGTLLQDTELRIEVLPANGLCNACSKVFGVVASSGTCPQCGSKDFELLGGKEFMIKEVLAL